MPSASEVFNTLTAAEQEYVRGFINTVGKDKAAQVLTHPVGLERLKKLAAESKTKDEARYPSSD